MSAQDIVLHRGLVRAVISARHGGRIRSLQVSGVELLGRSVNPDVPKEMGYGCFPMAPFAGKIPDGVVSDGSRTWAIPPNLGTTAAHGLVFDCPWRVLGATGTEAFLEVDLDERWLPGGWVRLSYRLIKQGLTAQMIMGNDLEPMPGSLGFHPWFTRDHDGAIGYLDMQAEGDSGSPRDCFFAQLARAPSISWPDARLALRSSSKSWTIYEEGMDLACLEPWTHGPGSVAHSESMSVSPGMPMSLDFTIQFHRRLAR